MESFCVNFCVVPQILMSVAYTSNVVNRASAVVDNPQLLVQVDTGNHSNMRIFYMCITHNFSNIKQVHTRTRAHNHSENLFT
jgi:hypothetical protein